MLHAADIITCFHNDPITLKSTVDLRTGYFQPGTRNLTHSISITETGFMHNLWPGFKIRVHATSDLYDQISQKFVHQFFFFQCRFAVLHQKGSSRVTEKDGWKHDLSKAQHADMQIQYWMNRPSPHYHPVQKQGQRIS